MLLYLSFSDIMLKLLHNFSSWIVYTQVNFFFYLTKNCNIYQRFRGFALTSGHLDIWYNVTIYCKICPYVCWHNFKLYHNNIIIIVINLSYYTILCRLCLLSFSLSFSLFSHVMTYCFSIRDIYCAKKVLLHEFICIFQRY